MTPRMPVLPSLYRWLPPLVVAALVASVTVLLSSGGTNAAVAYFASTTGIYEGDEVRILGVPVGAIDRIEPEGHRVRVEFHYDAGEAVPADAKAAIVAPSLVTSRYLQLAPRYTGGPMLADGAVIPMDRTAVPVEWDEIKQQVLRLTEALGPEGADRTGSLSRALGVAAENLDGQGQTVNDTIRHFSKAIETLSHGRQDLFGTVRNLQVFVSALATSDQQIVEFNQRLADVSDLLASNREDLGAALSDVRLAVVAVEEFIRTNRDELRNATAGLGDLTGTALRQQEDLERLLHVTPDGLVGLYNAYHPLSNSIVGALSVSNLANPAQFVCSGVAAATSLPPQQAAEACAQYLGPLLDLLTANYPPVQAHPIERPGNRPVPSSTGGGGEQSVQPPGVLVPDLEGLLSPGGGN